jgi:hypothetical protein
MPFSVTYTAIDHTAALGDLQVADSPIGTLGASFTFPVNDSANIPRECSVMIGNSGASRGTWPVPCVLLYNDSDGNNEPTYNVTRDPDLPTIVDDVSMLDPIYAVPAGVWSSVERTDPVVLDRDSIPAVYFNYTYHNFVMSTLENDTMLQSTGLGLQGGNWCYPSANENVTFDLTYGFWLYYTANSAGAGNYTLKIDTSLTNMTFTDPSAVPSDLKMFLGNIVSTYFEGNLLTSVVSNDTAAQQTGFGTTLISLTTLPTTYSVTDASGTYSATCTRSALPVYIDSVQTSMGKPVGDSSHIYTWVLGASFAVTNQTTGIAYDPQTTFFAAAPPGSNSSNSGPNWILILGISIAVVAAGVAAVAFVLLRRRKLARNKATLP